ncbi:hypothetical protein ACJVDH_15320 [Pedobacter sp. AW1-32]|uniref:hypothetical protein n=1 Tax=Pedobacter sp. AW1-32 TaxID=3383026 RepID=UPI003FF0CCF7
MDLKVKSTLTTHYTSVIILSPRKHHQFFGKKSKFKDLKLMHDMNKINNPASFPSARVVHWEKSDGVNFAIALARITGWMLQVDWLTGEQEATEKDMIPVRVYVETNQDVVFDFTGKKGIFAFNKYIIQPVAGGRVRAGKTYISTRCYQEEDLLLMPLRVQADEQEIERAKRAILANLPFLHQIPKRQNPEIPAYLASKYSHGNCIPFAQALSDLTGFPAMGISVSRFHPDCGNNPGFCHAIVMHPDGSVEDSWGKQTLQQVLDRFYILEYTISTSIYQQHKLRQQMQYEELYQQAFTTAKSLLETGH